MREAIIRFRFKDSHSSQIAYDTMRELGYQPVLETGDDVFHIHVHRQDLTSALEIAASQGGELIEEGKEERMMIDDAYGMDMIPIPAHLVNEDWVDDENYANRSSGVDMDDLSSRDEEERGWNDEETTNHFTGGVHL